MNSEKTINHLLRELNYYRREYNESGARIFRLQEEQGRVFREARRSRTVAKLIREAYRLMSPAVPLEEVNNLLSEIVLENMLCDRLAIVRRFPRETDFTVIHSLGFARDAAPQSISMQSAPLFFFTTSASKLEAPAYELTNALGAPYVLWGYDPGSGYAMILGNKTEGNISRPFEPADHELIEGALSVYVDILVFKEAERDLSASRIELENVRKSRSAILSALSRDFRTRLTSIVGFSDLLRGEALEHLSISQLRGYVDGIHQAGAQLNALVDIITEHASLEGAAPELNEEHLDVGDCMISVVERLRRDADLKNIRLLVATTPPVRTILADRRMIEEALHNLVDNAIKFTQPSGLVTFTGGMVDDAQNALFEINDNGMGIAKDDMPLIFEPFVKIGTDTGSGLGLSIARRLIELHGGTISIRSEPQLGTHVTVQLPASRNDPADS